VNKKLEQFKRDMSSKKVAVLGIGISNTPLIKYLAAAGTRVTAFDMSEEERLGRALEALKGLDVDFSLGKDYLGKLKGFDVIFKTPKIRFDIPELLAERQRGAVITSEMEVFCELCPARIFAVTGSDGKTTTATLIYKMLKEEGYNCWLGGNIGTPLLDRLDEVAETDMVVLELSSFQLHTMKNRLHTAVVTNMSPNHLDVHHSMEEYIDAKKNIFRFQKPEDTLVLNYDNEITRGFGMEAAGRVLYFSRTQPLAEGMTVEDGMLVYKEGDTRLPVISAESILLPGVHNIENYLAAAAAVIDFVRPRAVAKIASTFRGVEHRIEHVRDLGGVSFYNDSIGSSPTRTIASIRSFRQKVILIAGGYDKHIPYDEMGEIIADRVKALVLIGQTAPLIEKALRDETVRTGKGADIPVANCSTLEEAVKKAFGNAADGDIILLSPASASFDMFRDFEERGLAFKNIVNGLSF
jgi:UDP-N-acetylmuramoylalanine--D-glutamate ligase